MLPALYDEIKAYLEKKNQNPEAPYHSNAHMFGAWEICTQLWKTEQQDPNFCMTEPEEVMLATLMVACLFHDYAHSGGRKSDDENIKVAIRALKHFVLVESDVLNKDFKKKYPDSSGYLLWGAVAIVDTTQYPFKGDPHGRLESIMRDADVLYPSVDGNPEIVLTQLRKEMEVQLGQELARRVMAEGQRDFMRKVKLFTAGGQALWDRHASAYADKLLQVVVEEERNVCCE